MLRFHFDEHVSHSIANGLRQRGIDVTTMVDAGLSGADDEGHIEFARTDERVIFTNDDDFLKLAKSGLEHSGIFYCPVNSRSIGYIVDCLSFFSEEMESNEMLGKIEFI